MSAAPASPLTFQLPFFNGLVFNSSIRIQICQEG
jgi:hypothetical protein